MHVSRLWSAVAGGYPPIQRVDEDAEAFRDVGGWGSVGEEFPRGGDFTVRHEAFAAGKAALGSRGREACLGAFDGELAFHLRE